MKHDVVGFQTSFVRWKSVEVDSIYLLGSEAARMGLMLSSYFSVKENDIKFYKIKVKKF